MAKKKKAKATRHATKANRSPAKKPIAKKRIAPTEAQLARAKARSERARRLRAKVAPDKPAPAPRAASTAGAKRPKSGGKPAKNTPEDKRGGQFFKKLKVWQILHEHPERLVWTKQDLAEELFRNGDIDCDPDDEGDEEDDQSGETSAATKKDELEWVSGGPGAGHWKLKIQTRHKKDAQRQIEALTSLQIGVVDCDVQGNALTPEQVKARQRANKSEERHWKYDRDSEWARRLEELRTTHLLSGSALVGLKTLADLLVSMRGTPHQRSLEGLVDKVFSMVPEVFREEARQHARAWVHAVGSTGKYIRRKEDMYRWYVATLRRQQVLLDYTKPGESYIDPENRKATRTIAAFGTKYDAEESSLYLIGSEWEPARDEAGKKIYDQDGKVVYAWSKPKQFKLDRVVRIQPTEAKNPTIDKLPWHHLIKRDGVAVSSDRLDLERLYSESAGSYINYKPPVDIQFIVEAPSEDKDELWRAANWAAWCQEKPFHPRQFVHVEDGGRRLRVFINRCNADDVISRMLRLGVDFEIVEPAELRDRMRQQAEVIAKRHERRDTGQPDAGQEPANPSSPGDVTPAAGGTEVSGTP